MSEFWCWVGHSDNATHFKSGKMFHYWSNLTRDIEFVKMVWINFGFSSAVGDKGRIWNTQFVGNFSNWLGLSLAGNFDITH